MGEGEEEVKIEDCEINWKRNILCWVAKVLKVPYSTSVIPQTLLPKIIENCSSG